MKTGSLLQMSGCVVDLIYYVETLPLSGEEQTAHTATILPGGGFNAMFAARQFGLTVAYGGGHGQGKRGNLVRSAMSQNDIQILQMAPSSIDQGSCVVLIDSQGERTFVSHFGAEGVLEPSQLNQINGATYDWVLISGYSLVNPRSREVLYNWIVHSSEKVNFVFDPSPIVEQIPKGILSAVLRKACWVSCNAQEARWITQCEDMADATGELLERHTQKAKVVVRCGADGCMIGSCGNQLQHVPGFQVQAVDTNGAGDTHIGAFLAQLSLQKSCYEAARFANAAAALSTIQQGPATAPNRDAVEQFLENQI